MSEKTEMELFFEEQIAEYQMYREFADAGFKKWTLAYDAWKQAAEDGIPRRMKAPARQSVAPAIKEAIFSFPEGKQFTARNVFDAMSEDDLDYDKTRLSISAWLQHFVMTGEIAKVGRGAYEIARKSKVPEPGLLPEEAKLFL